MRVREAAHPVRPVQILIVDDDESDILLTRDSLRRAKIHNELHAVHDGAEALRFLRNEPPFEDAPRPDLILLDLNMPVLDGRGVLDQLKQDPDLRRIPVVVLTTSDAREDVLASYDLQASCFVTKPVDLEQFRRVVGSIQSFYFSVVTLP